VNKSEKKRKLLYSLRKLLEGLTKGITDFTKEQKSREIHKELGVKLYKKLLSKKGCQISEKTYQGDILIILPIEKAEKLGFRFAWCEVVRTHPPSSKKRKFLKEWMGKEGGLILIDQDTGRMKIERLNVETITTSIYSSDYL